MGESVVESNSARKWPRHAGNRVKKNRSAMCKNACFSFKAMWFPLRFRTRSVPNFKLARTMRKMINKMIRRKMDLMHDFIDAADDTNNDMERCFMVERCFIEFGCLKALLSVVTCQCDGNLHTYSLVTKWDIPRQIRHACQVCNLSLSLSDRRLGRTVNSKSETS